jgi:hypothetical protein
VSEGLEEWREILAGEEPLRHMRETAKGRLGAGSQRAGLQEELEELRLELRREGRKAAEDVVLDALDMLTGWCSPHTTI